MVAEKGDDSSRSDVALSHCLFPPDNNSLISSVPRVHPQTFKPRNIISERKPSGLCEEGDEKVRASC
jgi:hypothetical protein